MHEALYSVGLEPRDEDRWKLGGRVKVCIYKIFPTKVRDGLVKAFASRWLPLVPRRKR